VSLNYDLTGIDNYEQLCWDEVTDPARAEHIRKHGTDGFFAPAWREKGDKVFIQSPVTQSLIIGMMNLGLNGKITEKNVDEAVRQVAARQRVSGAYLRQKNDEGKRVPKYITEADVRAHIGLSTNCFGKDNTKTAFWRRMMDDLKSNSVRWLEREGS
jgi:hypothetical protein